MRVKPVDWSLRTKYWDPEHPPANSSNPVVLWLNAILWGILPIALVLWIAYRLVFG